MADETKDVKVEKRFWAIERSTSGETRISCVVLDQKNKLLRIENSEPDLYPICRGKVNNYIADYELKEIK